MQVHSVWREDIGRFELTQPLVTSEVSVEVGFTSDGFTGYWFTRWLVPPVDKGWYSAWVHDKCYDSALKTKLWADRLFYRNLRKAGVKKLKAKLMYLAVRKFGKGKYED